jgi:hypothetical protein
MATPPRKRAIKEIESTQSLMLQALRHTPHFNNIEERLHNLNVKVNSLMRKVSGSANSVKDLPTIARILFGLQEDLIRWGLPAYPFAKEKAPVNQYLTSYLDGKRRSHYSGECASYGETLLNCYLDSFITLTVLKTPKEIGAKPSFLVNPSTGSLLELDILFEEFRLAFELQGEHHYVDPKVIAKDAFKLAECHRNRKVLIPLNLGQLQSSTIRDLIANSIKDALKLHDVVALNDPAKYTLGSASQQELTGFKKAVQRMYLASELFDDTLKWLDTEAASYIGNMAARSPISVATPAPRWSAASPNLPLGTIYASLRYVSAIERAS